VSRHSAAERSFVRGLAVNHRRLTLLLCFSASTASSTYHSRCQERPDSPIRRLVRITPSNLQRLRYVSMASTRQQAGHNMPALRPLRDVIVRDGKTREDIRVDVCLCLDGAAGTNPGAMCFFGLPAG
jgi:hypothetical protein